MRREHWLLRHTWAMAVGADQRLLAEIRQTAADAGLDAIGVTDTAPFIEARQAIEERKADGLHAGMWFTYGRPERATTPADILTDARSIVVCVRNYEPPGSGGPLRDIGRVAAYSASDAYTALREGLDKVCEVLVRSGHSAVAVSDDNRLVDRSAAARAGLGWFGRNTMLLSRELGSWSVLGSVITTADLPISGEMQADGCGTCNRCQSACPTGALDKGGVLDANRCLAWLIQAPGVFAAEHRIALGDRLYGCDDCQTVCPFNDALSIDALSKDALSPEVLATGNALARNALAHSEVPADLASRGPSSGQPVQISPRRGSVDVVEMLQMTDEELMRAFGQWYIARRQPSYLRRNALVVLGNVGDPDSPTVAEVLRLSLGSRCDIVAAHAVWAARRLGRDDLVIQAQACGLGDKDPDGLIAAELARSVPRRYLVGQMVG